MAEQSSIPIGGGLANLTVRAARTGSPPPPPHPSTTTDTSNPFHSASVQSNDMTDFEGKGKGEGKEGGVEGIYISQFIPSSSLSNSNSRQEGDNEGKDGKITPMVVDDTRSSRQGASSSSSSRAVRAKTPTKKLIVVASSTTTSQGGSGVQSGQTSRKRPSSSTPISTLANTSPSLGGDDPTSLSSILPPDVISASGSTPAGTTNGSAAKRAKKEKGEKVSIASSTTTTTATTSSAIKGKSKSKSKSGTDDKVIGGTDKKPPRIRSVTKKKKKEGDDTTSTVVDSTSILGEGISSTSPSSSTVTGTTNSTTLVSKSKTTGAGGVSSLTSIPKPKTITSAISSTPSIVKKTSSSSSATTTTTTTTTTTGLTAATYVVPAIPAKPEETVMVHLSVGLSAIILGLQKAKEEAEIMNKLSSTKFREEIGLKAVTVTPTSTSSSSSSSATTATPVSTMGKAATSALVLGKAASNTMKISRISEYIRAAMDAYSVSDSSVSSSTSQALKEKSLALVPIYPGLLNIPKQCIVALKDGNGAASVHSTITSVFETWTALMRGSHGPPMSFLIPSQLPDLLTSAQVTEVATDSTAAAAVSTTIAAAAASSTSSSVMDLDKAKKREFEIIESAFLRKEKIALGLQLPLDEMLRPHAFGSGVASYPIVKRPNRPIPVRDTYGLFDEQFRDAIFIWDFLKTFTTPPPASSSSSSSSSSSFSSSSNASQKYGNVEPLLDVTSSGTGEEELTLLPYVFGTEKLVTEISTSLNLLVSPLPLPLQLSSSSYVEALTLEGGDYSAEGGLISTLEDRPPRCEPRVADPALSTLDDFIAALRGTSFKSFRFLARVHVAIIRFLLEDFDRLNNLEPYDTTSTSAPASASQTAPIQAVSNTSIAANRGTRTTFNSRGTSSSNTKKNKKGGRSKSGASLSNREVAFIEENENSDFDYDDDHGPVSSKKGAALLSTGGGGGLGSTRNTEILQRKVTFSDLYCDSCGDQERSLESELQYLTTLSWPTVLRRLLLTNSIGALLRQYLSPRAIFATALLGDIDYIHLPMAFRLEILKGLIDCITSTASFRSFMDKIARDLVEEISKCESERDAEDSALKERIRLMKEAQKEREKEFDPFIKIYFQRELKLKGDKVDMRHKTSKLAVQAASTSSTTITSTKTSATSASAVVASAATAESPKKGLPSQQHDTDDVTDDEDTTLSAQNGGAKRTAAIQALTESVRTVDISKIEKAIALAREAGFEKDLGRKLGKSYEPELAYALRTRDRLLVSKDEASI
jgi:hypothetical protein